MIPLLHALDFDCKNRQKLMCVA